MTVNGQHMRFALQLLSFLTSWRFYSQESNKNQNNELKDEDDVIDDVEYASAERLKSIDSSDQLRHLFEVITHITLLR